MSNSKWKTYFDHKVDLYGASVKSSDYFDDTSFFNQRENIFSWLGELKNQQILDAGCGVGAFSEPLVKDNKVFGVDFSEKSLKFAAARGLCTMTGDLSALKFEDSKFDLVLCIGVFQLIEQYKPILKELARVTAPGGTMLVQTLHSGSLQRKVFNLFERNSNFDKMYSMDELNKMFLQYGFEDIKFLKMYHPFQFVTKGSGEGRLSDMFCTSFAIKGRKKID